MAEKFDLVVFHDRCSDGFASAWIASRAGCRDAVFLPASHGDKPPDVAGKRVLILDFSYSREVLRGMAGAADVLVLLDHHRTAWESLRPDRGEPFPFNVRVVFDLEKCGARLAWEYFHPGEPAPPLVDYVEDRDLWKWELPDSRAVSAAIRSYPFTFERWDWFDQLLKGRPVGPLRREVFVAEGDAILRYQDEVVAQHVRNAVEGDLGGHKILIVNATTLHSEIAGELAKGREFGAVYSTSPSGRTVFSLRSDPEGIDVSEVAKTMGGGGHKHSAGFEA